MMSHRLARLLGFADLISGVPATQIIAASEIANAHTLALPKLQFKSFEVENLDFVCLDIPRQMGVAGLLGLNFIPQFQILLDLPNGLIKIERPTKTGSTRLSPSPPC